MALWAGVQLAAGQAAPSIGQIGALYLQDDGGKLIPLEQRTWRIKLKGLTAHLEVEGARSPVRVKSGQKLPFLVRFGGGVKSVPVLLLHLEITDKGNRKAEPMQKETSTIPSLPVKSTKFGESSYRLTPAPDLAAGEYAFVYHNSKVLYCFGVD